MNFWTARRGGPPRCAITSGGPRSPSREGTVAGLLWLAMNFPAVCDAMLDKTEFDAVDDEDPGHDPVVAWRLPGIPA